MATHLDLEEQEQLDQLKAFWKQYGNLITWAADRRAGGVRRPGTAGTGGSATRRPRPARCTTNSTRPRRPATPPRRRGIFADMKERFPRTAFAAARRAAGGQAAVRQGPGRRRRAPALAWVAEQRRRRPSTRRSPACAWPACCSTQKKYDEALKQLDAADAPRSSRRWWPTGAATCCWRRARRDEARGRLPGGLEGDGRQGRVPPPDRSQADRAGRRAARPRRPRAAAVGEAAQVTLRAPARARAGAGLLALAAAGRLRAPTSPSPSRWKPVDAADRRPPGLESASVDSVQFPLSVAVAATAIVHRRRRATARCWRSRPTAAASSGAPKSAPR